MAISQETTSVTNETVVNKPQTIWRWILCHRASFFWLPLTVVAVWLGFHGYYLLTGRAPVDDMPVGALGNLLKLVMAAILTINLKRLCFDDIDTTQAGIPWWRVLIDSLESVFLLWFTWYALSH